MIIVIFPLTKAMLVNQDESNLLQIADLENQVQLLHFESRKYVKVIEK